ncbi:MAG: EamA family transporter [Chitinophagales bacterium]|nr:EamA family transporter [Chitinophagales bacterium]
MMISLLLSIACSTFLVICFKYFDRFGIHHLQAIVFNYLTCVITGCIISKQFPAYAEWMHQPWFLSAAFLGCSYFFIFNLMAYVTRHMGITVTSVASKLSMVVPVIAAVILYNQKFNVIKILALLLAIISVCLTSYRKDDFHENKNPLKGFLLPLIIFTGSGINDSIVNYSFAKFLKPDEFDSFNISIFSFASLSGLLTLVLRSIFFNEPIAVRSIIGGVVLGIPNYLSLLFLLLALAIPGWESSRIFPLNNMGIVILSAGLAWILFREKLSKKNLAGIIIALFAIGLMIYPADQ